MTKHTKILTVGLITAAVLALGVGSATARRFSASEIFYLSHFREITFAAGSFNVVCAFSMEGSFHSKTIEKVNRALIGYVSEVRIKRPCTGGEVWALTTQEGRTESLPWHILYERFIGPLPEITGIETTADNTAYLVNVLGVNCLFASTTTSPMKGIINRNTTTHQITGLRSNELAAIPLKEGSGFCPSSGTLRGEGIVGTQVGYRAISVQLVA